MKELSERTLTDYVTKYKKDHSVVHKESAVIAVNHQLKTYSSIQEIKCLNDLRPLQFADSYFQWLSHTSKSVIKTEFVNNTYNLYFRYLKKPLLTLSIIETIENKISFAVSGGLLAKQNQRGTFTFTKNDENERHYLIALENFETSLPWWLYRITQAPIHEIVMRSFQKRKRG